MSWAIAVPGGVGPATTIAGLGTTAAVTLVAVLAGLAGAAVAWNVRPGPPSPSPLSSQGGSGPVHRPGILAVACGLATAAGVGGVGLVALGAGGLDFFGVIHLAYLGVVVSVPLVGLAVGARALVGGSLPRPWALAAVVLVVPAVVGGYATHVEPHRLTVERVTVPVDDDRRGSDPLRVGVLSDLQTNDVGDHERRAVDALMAEEPDLILLPGDLFQGTAEMFADHEDELRDLLGRLEAPGGVFFVRGDVDHGDFADRALRGTGVEILDDEVVDVRVGDRLVRLGGNRLFYMSPGALRVRRELGAFPDGGSDDGAIRILVSHRPDVALDLPADSRLDLVVAGHTHGGQVTVPGLGPLITMSDVPREVASGGLHDLDGNPIYVASGVGLERGQAPQVRLFTPPSIGVLTLR